MGINPIQQLKNNQSSVNYQLQSQAELANKLLENNKISEIDEIERLSKENNKDFQTNLNIQIDQKFQNKIVILEIESKDTDSIIIRGRHGLLTIAEQLDTKTIKAPAISFVARMGEIIGTMQMFSQKNIQAKRLRGWLLTLQEKLKTTYPDELSYLIINDRTKFEIPWEMLTLENNNLLGASIVTVRWQDITNTDDLVDGNSLINLEVAENSCSGKMVAYLNTKDLPEVQEEKKNIDKLKPFFQENIHNFFQFLDNLQLHISLIFIASHGFFGDDLSKSKLGEEDTKQQISLIQLYEYNFDFLKKSPSIVFINSCHSGRLQYHDSSHILDQDYPMGFSTFFLEKGAAGVIGTLCKVADKYAAIVSRNFFEEYEENPHLSVATILKNLRLKAIQKYQSEKNDDNKLSLIFTFMYIYYGNPMATLNIIPHEEN
ncbi:MAG: CHAT domain-containing protein [Nostocales cyanobacterium ELA583]|jgi:CHAT domain-containing protein